ncbi:hypothetical protein HYALB_00003908 [Hymenoscyphus albidus]|uniref:Uncharacterized protein n=1 Tax=Hymenoscyphus albidus TaxID=595503 RepID=A0A9N9LU71_9HELO|nr:hypothetical protein HYALB_00003908 [Hymenoscyphus albidus]
MAYVEFLTDHCKGILPHSTSNPRGQNPPSQLPPQQTAQDEQCTGVDVDPKYESQTEASTQDTKEHRHYQRHLLPVYKNAVNSLKKGRSAKKHEDPQMPKPKVTESTVETSVDVPAAQSITSTASAAVSLNTYTHRGFIVKDQDDQNQPHHHQQLVMLRSEEFGVERMERGGQEKKFAAEELRVDPGRALSEASVYEIKDGIKLTRFKMQQRISMIQQLPQKFQSFRDWCDQHTVDELHDSASWQTFVTVLAVTFNATPVELYQT